MMIDEVFAGPLHVFFPPLISSFWDIAYLIGAA
jgi:hypothetical protein